MSKAPNTLWLLFTVASLSHAADFQVAGVVVDSQSNAPLAHARVILALTMAREQKIEQVTRDDGRFWFAISQPGKYSLQVSKPGYPAQSFRQARSSGVSSAIAVRDGQDTTHVVFQAHRGASIEGQVKDENSDPVANAQVSIFQSLIFGGELRAIPRGQTRANAAGEFRFANLERGDYYVCAMGRPWFADSVIQLMENETRLQRSISQARGEPLQSPVETLVDQVSSQMPKFSADPNFRGTAFVTTFYPRAPTIQEASPVRLNPGDEAQISVVLPFAKAVRISGTINAGGPLGGRGRIVLFKKIQEQRVSFLDGWFRANGEFGFQNVPPGDYEIVASSQNGEGSSNWVVRQDIDVGVTDLQVVLSPTPLSSISGHVIFDGQKPASVHSLFVSVRNQDGTARRSRVNEDGSYSMDRLFAGKYEIAAGATTYAIVSFTGPRQEQLPLQFDLNAGENLTRNVTYTAAVASIEGTVEKSKIPYVGAFILLMPKDPSRHWIYRNDQTDSDASFSLVGVPSGDYILIALSNGDDIAYRDPKVAAKLARLGKEIHVEPTDHLEIKLDLVETPSFTAP